MQGKINTLSHNKPNKTIFLKNQWQQWLLVCFVSNTTITHRYTFQIIILVRFTNSHSFATIYSCPTLPYLFKTQQKKIKRNDNKQNTNQSKTNRRKSNKKEQYDLTMHCKANENFKRRDISAFVTSVPFQYNVHTYSFKPDKMLNQMWKEKQNTGIITMWQYHSKNKVAIITKQSKSKQHISKTKTSKKKKKTKQNEADKTNFNNAI